MEVVNTGDRRIRVDHSHYSENPSTLKSSVISTYSEVSNESLDAAETLYNQQPYQAKSPQKSLFTFDKSRPEAIEKREMSSLNNSNPTRKTSGMEKKASTTMLSPVLRHTHGEGSSFSSAKALNHQRSFENEMGRDAGHVGDPATLEAPPGATNEDHPTDVLKWTTRYEEYIARMEKRITSLEAQLSRVGSFVNANAKDIATEPVEHTLDKRNMAPEQTETVSSSSKMIPECQSKSWYNFMNKDATVESEYVIEILIGEPQYYYQRLKDPHEEDFPRNNFVQSPENLQRTVSWPRHTHTSCSIPDRIRINSSIILAILARIDGKLPVDSPIVMLRPYKFLVHYEAQIRNKFNELESRWTTPICEESVDALNAHGFHGTVQPEPVLQDSEDSAEALQHFRCLIHFFDRYIKPTLDHLQDSSNRKILFKDLWYLFKPGDDVYMPLRGRHGAAKKDPSTSEANSDRTSDRASERLQHRYQMYWRIISTGSGRPNLVEDRARNTDTSLARVNPFKLHCYYIDFDGQYFGATIHNFKINSFEGERDITSLDLYPPRYLEKNLDVLEAHKMKGADIFRNFATFKHQYYIGTTLINQPCGCPLERKPKHQEHVDSEVIVDFSEVLRNKPAWCPEFSTIQPVPAERRELEEAYPLRYWKDREHTTLQILKYDHIHYDQQVDQERTEAFRADEPLFEPIPDGWQSNESAVKEKDLCLFPGRVFAFVLRNRTFAALWLWNLQPIEPRLDGLRSLHLRDDNKQIIQALVKTHFIKKGYAREKSSDFDVVRGKGKGLIILLHGAPGVGKTSTAESVAAAEGKPLFPITCGDLGLTAPDVEKALAEIFHFAQRWDCVLLLDEADVFLAQRTKTDIKRNSLVSVFLRILEFYTGILFLTTNRVGAFDEAFKSRISVSLYYPPLDKQQTHKIWKMNMNRLLERKKNMDIDEKGIMKFAKEHYSSSYVQGATWNGRQIRNAWKIAAALAEWDVYRRDVKHNPETSCPDTAPARPKLGPRQFNIVAEANLAFDLYLQETTGTTEAERAFNGMDRADDFGTGNGLAFGSSFGNAGPFGQQLSTNQWQERFPSISQQNTRETTPIPPPLNRRHQSDSLIKSKGQATTHASHSRRTSQVSNLTVRDSRGSRRSSSAQGLPPDFRAARGFKGQGHNDDWDSPNLRAQRADKSPLHHSENDEWGQGEQGSHSDRGEEEPSSEDDGGFSDD